MVEHPTGLAIAGPERWVTTWPDAPWFSNSLLQPAPAVNSGNQLGWLLFDNV